MRFFQYCVLSTMTAVFLSGCTTLGTIAEEPTATPANRERPALLDTYLQLDQLSDGSAAAVDFPDGFGAGGVTVERRYFSASGKQCRVAVENSTGKNRTLCRDRHGAVNAFVLPDGGEPR